MVIPKGWEAMHQSDQGVCFFNSQLEIVYSNEKAEALLVSDKSAMAEQLKCVCSQVVKLWESTPDSIMNHSGILKYPPYNDIYFNCFSFSQSGKLFICFAFDERSLLECTFKEQKIFTRREREILQEVKQGRNNREISQKMHISLETVKTHIRNILAKTGASSRTELLVKIVQKGIRIK